MQTTQKFVIAKHNSWKRRTLHGGKINCQLFQKY